MAATRSAAGSMKRCQRRYPAALRGDVRALLLGRSQGLFSPQAEPAKHAMDGRQPGDDAGALLQFGQRDVGAGLDPL